MPHEYACECANTYRPVRTESKAGNPTTSTTWWGFRVKASGPAEFRVDDSHVIAHSLDAASGNSNKDLYILSKRTLLERAG